MKIQKNGCATIYSITLKQEHLSQYEHECEFFHLVYQCL